MKKTRLLLFLFFALNASLSFAQMERTVYQSFEIDSAETITLQIVGDFELRAWAGNSILTETNVQIWNAAPKILDFFISEGRYEILMEKSPTTVNLVSKLQERKPIKVKDVECIENITLKIFVPDTFEWAPDDLKKLRKKPTAN